MTQFYTYRVDTADKLFVIYEVSATNHEIIKVIHSGKYMNNNTLRFDKYKHKYNLIDLGGSGISNSYLHMCSKIYIHFKLLKLQNIDVNLHKNIFEYVNKKHIEYRQTIKQAFDI